MLSAYRTSTHSRSIRSGKIVVEEHDPVYSQQYNKVVERHSTGFDIMKKLVQFDKKSHTEMSGRCGGGWNKWKCIQAGKAIFADSPSGHKVESHLVACSTRRRRVRCTGGNHSERLAHTMHSSSSRLDQCQSFRCC
mmetsp:Transcript_3912/g.14805  ORF Transcript_3912/g.14805 Transcript_3912/m.14805 type:complete len:136 (-) Transcript_3912:946-1353(-)